MEGYAFKDIEPKWQAAWEKHNAFEAEPLPAQKPKYYVLDMFPYPSGAGLHVGHPLGYIASDIVARYKRMDGFNVLHPMGFDAFGLPAEQYAIQTGQAPEKTTRDNIHRYRQQLKKMGLSFDWAREISTHHKDYYRWTQWIFIQLFESWYNLKAQQAEPISSLIAHLQQHGSQGIQACCDEDTPQISATQWARFSEMQKRELLLKYRLAYLAQTTVNWCPKLGTVLSNDEVKEGFSERGGHPVVPRRMTQWMMRITAYAERLLKGLDNLNWPESIKDTQRHWIGKSQGIEVNFASPQGNVTVFTTRPDTLYGVSFLALAPESKLLDTFVTSEQQEKVQTYLKRPRQGTEHARTTSSQGIFTGGYATHPLTQEKIPVWIADYVLDSYGTGAVMGVPAHDARDHLFAKTHQLPIKEVISGGNVQSEAHEEKKGILCHSGPFNGLSPQEAISKISAHLVAKHLGQKRTRYRLRDAIFGRQRYWGEPFPIYFKQGQPYALPEHELPLPIPKVDSYKPSAEGKPPLSRAENWHTSENYPYETSTMPGWAGSSWYFFRYMSPQDSAHFCHPQAQRYWRNVDLYVGGSEHAVGHLLYARFWTQFLYDKGYVNTREFAQRLVNQGMIWGESKLIHFLKNQDTTTLLSHGQLTHYTKKEYLAQHVHVDWVHNDKLDLNAFAAGWPEDTKHYRVILENGEKVTLSDKNLADKTYVCGSLVEKMSKSKHNVVNPDKVIEKYGADTLRLYEMFLGPLEQSKPWDTKGIEGVHRFLKKVWHLFTLPKAKEKPSKQELNITHRLVKKVREDMETLSFNTSVSALMIAVNELTSLTCRSHESLSVLLRALCPFAPHVAEELWHSVLKEPSFVSHMPFPRWEEKYLYEDEITYPVSINGKWRVNLLFPSEATEKVVVNQVLKHKIVRQWTEGKVPKRVVFVPQRIVNIVV